MNNYHSKVLDEFLSLGTPEELARTENRMMLAAKIGDAVSGSSELAARMGIDAALATEWLSGGYNFDVDTLTDIQRVLGIKLLDAGQ